MSAVGDRVTGTVVAGVPFGLWLNIGTTILSLSLIPSLNPIKHLQKNSSEWMSDIRACQQQQSIF